MKKLFLLFLSATFVLRVSSQVAFNIGTPYQDKAKSISQDERGNIYLTGTFQGEIDLDPGPATNLLLAQGDPLSPDSQDIFVARYSSEGDFDWGFSISSPGEDMSYTVEVKGGFVYVCGFIQGEAEFDPGATPAIFNSGDGQDAFIAVYDTLGNFVWAEVLGDEEGAPFIADDVRYEVAYDLSVDESGNIYLAGAFTGSMDFEPNNSSPFDTFFSIADGNGIPGRDIFIVSYDASGNYRWGFGVGGMDEEQAQAITYRDGAIFVGGKFVGTTDLNPSGQQSNLTSNGNADAFLVRYQASDGTFDWAASWGGAATDEVSQGAIDLDTNGKVIAGGNFEGGVNFDPMGNGQMVSSQGASDIFLSQFSVLGVYDWTQTRGSALADFLTAVNAGQQGVIYTSGTFANKLYLEQWDELGTSNWIRELGQSRAPGLQQIEDISLSEEGDVYFSASFFQRVDIDPGADVIELSSWGESDVCVARYSGQGLLNTFATSLAPRFSQAISDLVIYPNPASMYVAIEFELLEKTTLYMALRNSMGQMVHEEYLGSRIGQVNYQLPLASLPANGYLLEIRSESGTHFERIWKK